ncbi:uncharacterized protein TNCT_405671 [Trichonephila clavata]|uniref:Uncharacterized protein n=1 Tax=Trichonephila clavata TaxID=2740835 RepID=A0A8X6GRW7_TRICU|nr:uncharacterized protein TNCT_405671 [Trichonephila clavata]
MEIEDETEAPPVDLDDAVENGGIFFMTQILPVVIEEDLRPAALDAEGDDEVPRTDAEEDLCTYQLGPTAVVKPAVVTAIAKRVLKRNLQNKEYSAYEMKDDAIKISSDIREELKNLMLDRYRIVCQVTIGEKCDQDVAMAFLCLWKHEFDHYAVATFDGVNFFATAVVFMVYKQ